MPRFKGKSLLRTNKMKIFSDGADCPQCQRWRIERGFKKLGHQIVLDISKADLIYINTVSYTHLTLPTNREV